MNGHHRRLSILGAVVAAIVLTACTTQPSPSVTPSPLATSGTATPESQEAVTVIADGLDAPWSVTFHEGAALVSERDSARILEIGDDGAVREAGIVPGVVSGGEGGLLGIAAHDEHLYVYLTAADENRIDRYALTGAPGSLGLGEAETIHAGMPAARNHNGGRIAFGPDGMLYATVGDAGDRAAAQNLDSLSGKILRLTPEGDIPPDNPIPGSPVYSYGHRNPQGIAWDEDGVLYASEFGQDTWDELNVVEPGGNHGWPEVEGAGGEPAMVDPVQQWPPAEASPSGIAIAGGSIFIANLRGERLRVVPLGDLAAWTELFVGEYGRLRDVVVAPDGALWLLTNNTDGRGRPRDGDDRIIRVPAP
ncbi:sorbosone dehydrogenase family protein [Microbacterium sp. CIAB417]|uniref:PQQ-dependent sugar dehydrogenase n=1 Tax=Microbacterium sp. CIAB417 TaxID=2860287 RepID=UPI001FACB884|nr:PQQ-dependent sugar dehydrogenase [Microbacterium sp. CIAB417]